jgi:tetratricopeptide (TPR) repeat protein
VITFGWNGRSQSPEYATTDLSRIADSFVISRNTAFIYRNKPVDTKQSGRELGARYVLEESVRRSGDQIRINAQLIDAETDAHLWAERFDRCPGDLFALQNEITSRIAVTLNMELLGTEAARPTSHPDALDYILRGRAAGLNTISRAKYAEAILLFERALALDPHSVEAQSRLADMLIQRVTSGMSDWPTADIARAKGLVGQAFAGSPRSPLAHFVRAQVLQMEEYRLQEALPEYETALWFDRTSTGALNGLGICKLMTGSLEEVIPLMEQAIRLSPRDPQSSSRTMLNKPMSGSCANGSGVAPPSSARVPQARCDARGCAVGLAALSPTLLPRAVQHDDTTARSKLRTEAGNARSSAFALNRAAPRGHGRLSLLGCGFVNAGLRPPPPAAVGVDKAASQQPLGHRAFDGQKGLAKSPKARLVLTCASEPAEKALSISSVEHWDVRRWRRNCTGDLRGQETCS